MYFFGILVYKKKNTFKHKILRYSAFQWSQEKLQEGYRKEQKIFYATYVTKIIKHNELTFHKELDKEKKLDKNKISKELLALFTSSVPVTQVPQLNKFTKK